MSFLVMALGLTSGFIALGLISYQAQVTQERMTLRQDVQALSDRMDATRERIPSRAPCRHERTVPVESVTGELVARICVKCDVQLGAGHGCPDCEYVEARTLAGHVQRFTTKHCEEHA